jgi:glutamine synthetase
VYTERELHSQYNILAEGYVKTVTIEGKTASMMARTMILPACLRYQAQVAEAVNATKAAGVDPAGQLELLRSLTETITNFQKTIHTLDHALSHHAQGELIDHARHARDAIVPAMADLRKVADKLETMVADDLWPLPTYREMLFIR